MFAQGIHEKAYPASITKIITAILAIKYGDMDDVVTISQNAVTLEEGSQLCGFQPGDMVTMDELSTDCWCIPETMRPWPSRNIWADRWSVLWR